MTITATTFYSSPWPIPSLSPINLLFAQALNTRAIRILRKPKEKLNYRLQSHVFLWSGIKKLSSCSFYLHFLTLMFFYFQYSSESFQITIDEVVNEVLERGPLNLTIFTRKTVERSHDLTAMKLHIWPPGWLEHLKSQFQPNVMALAR